MNQRQWWRMGHENVINCSTEQTSRFTGQTTPLYLSQIAVVTKRLTPRLSKIERYT